MSGAGAPDRWPKVCAINQHKHFAIIASIVTRPLGSTRADQRRFVDRAGETETILRALAATRPVLVLGEPGSGRTSLLHHVAWSLRRQTPRLESILISGELARDAAQLLGVLVARVQRLAAPSSPRAQWMADLSALAQPDGPFGPVVAPAIVMELIDLLGEQVAALPGGVCLMLDGVAPSVAHAVFGSLRNELWALEGVRWVVAGDLAAAALYREPPADAFFEQTVQLQPLSDGEARALLHAHLPELPAAALEAAIAAGAGNPRRLLRAAGTEGGAAHALSGGVPELAVAAGGRLAGALTEYLAAHGPTSASDPGLLREIGASRQRASQLMHQLQSAGLLETLDYHEPGRRGRPARLFALRSPT